MIDNSQIQTQLQTIGLYIVVYGILLLLSNVLGYLQNYPETYLKNGITEQIKIMALKKMSRIEYKQYQKNGTGKIVQIIENGALAGTDIILSFFLRILSDLLPSIVFSLLCILCFLNKNIHIIHIRTYFAKILHTYISILYKTCQLFFTYLEKYFI